jgi:hypothetical protein
MRSHIWLFNFSVAYTFSPSQAHGEIPNNKWKVNNLAFSRFLNTTKPVVGAYFELDRIYYEPCAVPPGVIPDSSIACGIKTSQYPIICNSWSDGYANGNKDHQGMSSEEMPRLRDYSTCGSYRISDGNETLLPEDAKQWLRWRLFDLQEVSNISTNAETGRFRGTGGVFQSIKLQFLNGVPMMQQ